jgi:F-type H+-transporting ATPase subunit gamma
MANRRVLIKRRKAVRNIRKITRTMQLIATARFQAALSRATASQPYTRKLAELAADLTRAAGDVDHPLMKTHEDAPRSSLLILSSMRGLCGGYNANVLRSAIGHLEQREQAGRPADVHMVGKKGIGYFRFLKRAMAEQTTDIDDRPKYEQVEPIADALIRRFMAGEISSAHVAYMQFVSMGKQRPHVMQLLPLAPEAAIGEEAGKGPSIEYEFSPAPKELLDDLLPATVRIRLFQCFLDAAVSEQIARMVAMKAATDAAGDMIKFITRQYNRARQTAITMELLDIVGGANALE